MGDPFSLIAGWLRELLLGWGLSPGLATLLLKFLGAALMGTVALFFTFFTIWLERKIIARMQDRLGPNRVGPYGILQTIADFLKLVTKEVLIPQGADRIIFLIAPLLVVMSVVALWAVIPFAPTLFGTDINVGVLYILSIGSVGSLGILMAGLSSNNKYALLGAFRTVAMMLSYAVPMILALLVPTMLAGSMGMVEIVEAQRSTWFVALAPLAALLFFVSSIAEVGRAPFDLLEAESELVAGFQVEYSGLSFGMFYVADFLHAFTISALTTTLFLGGWQGPWAETYPLLGFFYFVAKTAMVYFVVIWIRGTFPRIRIDQLNALNWKIFVPLGLAVVIVAALLDKAASELGLQRTLIHLAGNGLLLVLTLIAIGMHARTARRQSENISAGSMESPYLTNRAR
jgi:NADH-quinone oxidoreductase subunit H